MTDELSHIALQTTVKETMTADVHSFPAIANAHATRLILGSMPGAASLSASQYYAHPHNAFWRIMATLTGVAPNAAYGERLQGLHHAKIAVWDVLQCCQRAGSLDSAIRRDSEIGNDFGPFFAQHPHVTHVFFNGSAAQACFKRHCSASLRDPSLHFQRLPSTSPAHASLRFEQKLAVWCDALA